MLLFRADLQGGNVRWTDGHGYPLRYAGGANCQHSLVQHGLCLPGELGRARYLSSGPSHRQRLGRARAKRPFGIAPEGKQRRRADPLFRQRRGPANVLFHALQRHEAGERRAGHRDQRPLDRADQDHFDYLCGSHHLLCHTDTAHHAGHHQSLETAYRRFPEACGR